MVHAGVALAPWFAVACRGRGAEPAATPPLVLEGARVLSGVPGEAIEDGVIVIAGGRIQAVGRRGAVPLPERARRLDVSGLAVLPGFVDVHYHVTTAAMRYRRSPAGRLDSTYDRALAERLLRVALAFGITTVRDPAASPADAAVRLRDDVARGRVLGPRIKTAGALISGPRLTEDTLRRLVRAQAAERVDYVKVYSGLGPAQVRVVVDEAHRLGLPVIGHLQRTSWTEAADAGIDFITHAGSWHSAYLPPARRAAYDSLGGTMRARVRWLEELDLDGPAVDSMARVLAARRVSVDPTLVAYHTKFWWRDSLYQRDPAAALVPEVAANWRVLGMPTADWTAAEFDRAQAAWPKLLALVRRLHERGVLLTAGSDVASPWVVPGVAFHQELALLRGAGFGEAEVLAMATRNGARALGLDRDVGTVAAGRRADLVVLERDPRQDIGATRAIRYVVKDGVVHRPDSLLGGPVPSAAHTVMANPR